MEPDVRRSMLVLATTFLAAAFVPARADEGMWTFNDFPADKVEKAYGFRPDQKWLDHVRLASVRLAEGCSAGFVSPRGLVQTNHHCARDCVEQLSTADNDMVAKGFYAREETDEIKCPTIEANQLVDINPVTNRISAATAGKDGAAFAAALKAERARIEQECAGQDDSIRCDVVELYQGGVYDLYKYRRYQDVRLVFAPEEAIAFFGGDPDNFEFPRYDFDVSYLRVYADSKPLDTSRHYFRYAAADARPGDVVFMSGNPGSSSRLETVAELALQRDVWIPKRIFLLSEMRGQLTRFSAEGPEHARSAKTLLFDVENSLKAIKVLWRHWSNPPSSGTVPSPSRRCAPRSTPIRHCARNTAKPGTTSGTRRSVSARRSIAPSCCSTCEASSPRSWTMRGISCATRRSRPSRTASASVDIPTRHSRRCASSCCRARRSTPIWRS